MTSKNPFQLLRRRLVAVAAGVALAVPLMVTAGAAPASAGPPSSATAPSHPRDSYVLRRDPTCPSGNSKCLDKTLAEQGRIADQTASTCDHNAIFARAYVRMTQLYGHTRKIPGYYKDLRYMNHMDAVFAKYYTDAYGHWQSGKRSAVPQAWLTAFDAAKSKTTTGSGDLLLGMNAHINRDLPFVLASVLTRYGDDADSRYADYKAVEKWLFDSTAPLTAEFAQRFDPSMGLVPAPSSDTSDGPPTGWLVSLWRDNAWANAEALVDADTPAARAAVAEGIEENANQIAQGLLASMSYVPGESSTGPRDSWCAEHRGDKPPEEYAFGEADPFGIRY